MRYVLCTLLVVAQFAIGQDIEPEKPAEPLVLAFYYTWYGTPDGPTGRWDHWTEGGHDPVKIDERGWRDLGAAQHPIDGPYDSLDPATIQRHVRLAKMAGIDGWISTWWNQGDRHDRALSELLAELRLRRSDFRVSAYLETIGGSADRAVRDLDYLLTTYGEHPNYLRVRGRPVVFVYSRAMTQLSVAEWRQVVEKIRTKHDCLLSADTEDADLIELFGAGHGYNPVNLVLSGRDMTRYSESFVEKCREKRAISALTVLPGYDDRPIRKPGLYLGRKRGRTYRDLWAAATLARPDWILITSFNEWHEGTEIEPSRENGYHYLRETRIQVDRFRRREDSRSLVLSGVTITAESASRLVWGRDDARGCEVIGVIGESPLPVRVAGRGILVSRPLDDSPTTPAAMRLALDRSSGGPLPGELILQPDEEIQVWRRDALLDYLARQPETVSEELRSEMRSGGTLALLSSSLPSDGRGRRMRVVANSATPLTARFLLRDGPVDASDVMLRGDARFRWRSGAIEADAGVPGGQYQLELLASRGANLRVESDLTVEVVETFAVLSRAVGGKLEVRLSPRVRLAGELPLVVSVGDRVSDPMVREIRLRSGQQSVTAVFPLTKLVDLRSSAPPGSELSIGIRWTGGRQRSSFFVDADLSFSKGIAGSGLRHVGSGEPGDGGTIAVDSVGRRARRSLEFQGHPGYFYFDLDPAFLDGGPVLIEVDYLDRDADWIVLQYDSGDETLPSGGGYKSTKRQPVGTTGRWKTARFELERPDFSGRQNFKADFRLHSGGALTIAAVRATHAAEEKNSSDR